jgi:TRAP-type C4-dicarboxylate transport system substrate-binding protein
MVPMHRRLFAVAALALAASGCTTAPGWDGEPDDPGTKAGGSGPVTTVRVATADSPGQPGVAQIEEFARQVDEISEGRLRVEVLIEAPEKADGVASGWDQAVARQVADGDVELGLVPSRAWASLGVTSLQVLTVPFLIQDLETLGAVVSGDLAGPMLEGLSAAGVEGLALWPEGLRRPFSFAAPLLDRRDYDGLVLRAPAATITDALFAALGATSTDLDGADFAAAVAAGDVGAAESSFVWAPGLPAPTVATGNVAFFPKVNVLVLGDEAAQALGTERVALLREAAIAARDRLLAEQPSERQAAQSFCEAGGTVVLAGAAQVAALQDAARPVVAELQKDPQNAQLMARVADLQSPDVDVVTPCAARGTDGAAVAAAGPPAVAEGVYRYELTEEYLLAGGLPVSQARADAGVVTVTMRDGAYTEQWRNETGEVTCEGTYVVAGSRMFMTWTPGRGCEGAWSALADVQGDTITWSEVQAIPPDPPERTLDHELYLGVPWTRVG